MEQAQEFKLTQYSRGAGCGCKIAPATLQEILRSDLNIPVDGNLLVGNGTNDDAAVYDLGNGTALISTTDFFMPIVDDAFDFGRIASANAISDVYAMGGKPLMAIAILGWPVEKLPAALAQRVLDGARSVCREAGIILAGGHSIDTVEPMFGLAVNGLCPLENLKRNNTAKEGDLLLLTGGLGVGVLATAQKRGLITDIHQQLMIGHLTRLNKIGTELGAIAGVTAMTDVTGFGLAGHLLEMAEGSGLSATINYSNLKILDGVKEYLAQRAIPDATYRNWNAFASKIGFGAGVDVMAAFQLLPDPQTNGGLLIAIQPDALAEVQDLLLANGLGDFMQPIGQLTSVAEKVITVNL